MATTSHRHPKIIEMAFDVARSSLRAITFAQNSAALRFSLTSIAPTPLTSHHYSADVAFILR
jgi:hypothetical protein